MSAKTQEMIRLFDALPETQRTEVEDFVQFLAARSGRASGSEGNSYQTIRHSPDVVGNDARVRDTRISVWTLVQLKKQGRTEAQLLTDYPGLTGSDLDAVWAYYREHTDEIENAIVAEAEE